MSFCLIAISLQESHCGSVKFCVQLLDFSATTLRLVLRMWNCCLQRAPAMMVCFVGILGDDSLLLRHAHARVLINDSDEILIM